MCTLENGRKLWNRQYILPISQWPIYCGSLRCVKWTKLKKLTLGRMIWSNGPVNKNQKENFKIFNFIADQNWVFVKRDPVIKKIWIFLSSHHLSQKKRLDKYMGFRTVDQVKKFLKLRYSKKTHRKSWFWPKIDK